MPCKFVGSGLVSRVWNQNLIFVIMLLLDRSVVVAVSFIKCDICFCVPLIHCVQRLESNSCRNLARSGVNIVKVADGTLAGIVVAVEET